MGLCFVEGTLGAGPTEARLSCQDELPTGTAVQESQGQQAAQGLVTRAKVKVDGAIPGRASKRDDRAKMLSCCWSKAMVPSTPLVYKTCIHPCI